MNRCKLRHVKRTEAISGISMMLKIACRISWGRVVRVAISIAAMEVLKDYRSTGRVRLLISVPKMEDYSG
jgi:hypothetical protein